MILFRLRYRFRTSITHSYRFSLPFFVQRNLTITCRYRPLLTVTHRYRYERFFVVNLTVGKVKERLVTVSYG